MQLTYLYQPAPQGSTVNELRARARKQYMLFKYGTTTPTETIFAQLQDTVWQAWKWAMDQVNAATSAAWEKTGATGEQVRGEL